MKLLEIISEQRILTEAPVDIPNLTRLSLDGVEYKWNGNSWIDSSSGNQASGGIGNRLSNLFKGLNPGKAVFDAGRAIPVAVGDRFLVNLADESFSFTKQSDANKFLQRLRSGKSINKSLSIFQEGKGYKKIGRSMWSQFKIGTQMTAQQIDSVIKDDSRPIGSLMNKPLVKGLFRMLSALGISVLLYQSFIINYDDVQRTPSDNFEGGESEKQELLDVITGLFVSQIVIAISAAFRLLKVATIINIIRSPIRSIQAGAAASGVGTIPSLVSMIATEAAFWGATYLLTRPGVQMKLAQWVANTAASAIFETVGNTADVVAQSLDVISNGAFGGATLRDALTFKQGVTKMPEGTSYASSEWAKIAFQGMIFPEDMNQVKVPYLISSDRTKAIYAVFDLDPTETASVAEPTRTVSSGELGTMSEYVFPYTPELLDSLKDTHEVAAISDKMGARAGSANQELYLVPTAQAMSNPPVPMPDERIVTRTGQRIERPTDNQDVGTFDTDAISSAIDSASN